ncbi:hypothetical protein AN478_05770 [Thiohalorhabdus denitrificans]|uniref:ATP-grasp domain-containing protein n=1 Tax=Thiohalorhabdus denitrificans TaxID=381306 RepID=A0A0P9EQ85_9GAMM|nr:hypothetical protein [Thiohalorhabdus denitrificans]KPV40666.1 hypothetical protein AN478_05770 [Thiohalorhabdus denitrificans]SCY47593.1 hypothetical protein SAMN05661077_2224 [Thiohalorhabdus denitrificans]
MPFHGVLPERRFLFDAAEPAADIGVSDGAAWRLNPAHRWVYNKLELALSQGLVAAPAGVEPAELGLGAGEPVFVRPITNLAGMAIGAHKAQAGGVAHVPGTFWCRYLEGEQSSTDCLVRDGEVVWFAHTVAGDEWVDGRPVYWRIGVERPANERILSEWVAANLPGYTGICNFELIGATLIEAHLRGSNGFFDFYGPGFVPAWAALVDEGVWRDPGPLPGGYLFSLFSRHGEKVGLDLGAVPDAGEEGVTVALDLDGTGRPANGRVAVIRSRDHPAGRRTLERLRAALGE